MFQMMEWACAATPFSDRKPPEPCSLGVVQTNTNKKTVRNLTSDFELEEYVEILWNFQRILKILNIREIPIHFHQNLE